MSGETEISVIKKNLMSLNKELFITSKMAGRKYGYKLYVRFIFVFYRCLTYGRFMTAQNKRPFLWPVKMKGKSVIKRSPVIKKDVYVCKNVEQCVPGQ